MKKFNEMYKTTMKQINENDYEDDELRNVHPNVDASTFKKILLANIDKINSDLIIISGDDDEDKERMITPEHIKKAKIKKDYWGFAFIFSSDDPDNIIYVMTPAQYEQDMHKDEGDNIKAQVEEGGNNVDAFEVKYEGKTYYIALQQA